MEFHNREKLYKQMLENPNNLAELNNDNLFFNLSNKTRPARLKIFDVTEFLNLLNSLCLFYYLGKLGECDSNLNPTIIILFDIDLIMSGLIYYFIIKNKRIQKKDTNIIFIIAYIAYFVSGLITKLINTNNQLAEKLGINNCIHPNFVDEILDNFFRDNIINENATIMNSFEQKGNGKLDLSNICTEIDSTNNPQNNTINFSYRSILCFLLSQKNLDIKIFQFYLVFAILLILFSNYQSDPNKTSGLLVKILYTILPMILVVKIDQQINKFRIFFYSINFFEFLPEIRKFLNSYSNQHNLIIYLINSFVCFFYIYWQQKLGVFAALFIVNTLVLVIYPIIFNHFREKHKKSLRGKWDLPKVISYY